MTIATASNNSPTVIVSENGQQGIKGTNGTNGTGFNSVRRALLDNPLCHLFKSNKLVETLAGTLTTNRATTATYVDRYGVIKTAAINTLREEKDGWLIEGASTNLLTYSDSTVAQLSVSFGVTNAASFPQFTNGIQFPATNTANTAYKLGGAINATIYTTSIFVVMNDLTAPKVGALITDDFQLVIDATATTTNLKIELINKSQALYRVSATLTSTGTSFTTGVSRSLGQSAKGFKITGFNQEELPFASSYIPTTTAAVTRAADIVSMTFNNNIGFPSDNYSVFSNVSIIGFIDNALSDQYLFNVTDETQRAIKLNENNLLRFIHNNSASGSQLGIAQKTYLGMTIDSTNINPYIDGIPLTSIAKGAVSGNGTIIQLGSIGGSQYAFAHLSDFRIYDFALNQEEVTYLSGV